MATAKEIFESLEEIGGEAINLLRRQAFTPNLNKTLRNWGITEVSSLVGRSDTYIREQEKTNQTIKKQLENKKRKRYSLPQINLLRKTFATSPHKNNEDEPAIIAFANFKGGAAKTTTSVHTAQYFALHGYKVLFIDCDSQGSATQMFGYSPDENIENDKTLLPCFLKEASSIKDIIKESYWDGLDIIPANLSLYGAEFALPARAAHAKANGKEYPIHNILSLYLDEVKDSYDIIIIDCPPSMGMISINAIYAANAFIVPTPPSMLDFSSTIQFFGMMREVLTTLPDKEYSFVRILITKHDNQDSNNTLVDTLRALYGNSVLRNMMFTSEAIRKASSDLLTLYEIEKYSGTKATLDRAIGLMNNVNQEIEILVRQLWPNTTTSGFLQKRLKIVEVQQ